MSSLFLVSQVIHGVYLSLCAVPCDVDGCFAFQLLIVSQFAAVNPLYERMNVSRYELISDEECTYVYTYTHPFLFYLFIYLEVCDYCVIPHCFVRLQIRVNLFVAGALVVGSAFGFSGTTILVAKDQTAPAMHGNTPVRGCLNTFCRSLS